MKGLFRVPGRSGRSVRAPFVVLVVIAAAGLVVFGTLLRSRPPAPTFATPLLRGPTVSGVGGRFAGYRDQVDVTSVAASWQVPRIARRSQAGVASTWVAAQGVGDGNTPFIQLGTEEEMLPDDGTPTPSYEAFFSDTVRHFHPSTLFSVSPGDTVSAGLALGDDHWTLTFRDLTSGAQRTVVTAQEGDAIFPVAEWLQEDVTNGATNRAEPYPDLTDLHVSGVSVNGRPVVAGQLESVWMGLPGGYLGPTALGGGAFSVRPVRLSSAAAAYLRIAEPEDTAGESFAQAVQSWSGTTSTAVVRHQTGAFVEVLERSATALAARPWPASVVGLIRHVVAEDRAQGAAMLSAARRGASAVQLALAELGTSQENDQLSAIRQRLGAPVAR